MLDAKHVHIIGVGGIGTSAVAKWFLARGANVSGSDMHPSSLIEDLDRRGAVVKIGHFADNIPRDCDLVIYSRAVPATNIERQAVSEAGITELSFAEFLGELAKTFTTIAVSGTHGKSTTTAMIASILVEAGLDPTVIVGTQVPGWEDGNLRIGKGKWLVVEACEHMASMLKITPDIAVITNIEPDHLDYYHDLEHIIDAFQTWVDQLSEDAHVVMDADDEASKRLTVSRAVRTSVQNRTLGEQVQTFSVGGQSITLRIPGIFNARNAVKAFEVARIADVDDSVSKKALEAFRGTWRRFEHVGVWQDADVYSDYAHHPTEIRVTLEAFREFYPNRRLVVCYEPHQHSRTHELFAEFPAAFDAADVVIMSEIYEVTGRTEEKFESSKDLAKAIEKRGKVPHVLYAEDLEKAENHVRDVAKKGDVIIIMGAGNIDRIARNLV